MSEAPNRGALTRVLLRRTSRQWIGFDAPCSLGVVKIELKVLARKDRHSHSDEVSDHYQIKY